MFVMTRITMDIYIYIYQSTIIYSAPTIPFYRDIIAHGDVQPLWDSYQQHYSSGVAGHDNLSRSIVKLSAEPKVINKVGDVCLVHPCFLKYRIRFKSIQANGPRA